MPFSDTAAFIGDRGCNIFNTLSLFPLLPPPLPLSLCLSVTSCLRPPRSCYFSVLWMYLDVLILFLFLLQHLQLFQHRLLLEVPSLHLHGNQGRDKSVREGGAF